MDDKAVARILELPKRVAVVGLSDKPDRPSFDVASYLESVGYRIVPVNPRILEWRGRRSYASLLDIPLNMHVDIIDVFRKNEEVPAVVADALERWPDTPKTLWLQLGVGNAEAEKKAAGAGWEVVSDRCMKIEHVRLMKIGLL